MIGLGIGLGLPAYNFVQSFTPEDCDSVYIWYDLYPAPNPTMNLSFDQVLSFSSKGIDKQAAARTINTAAYIDGNEMFMPYTAFYETQSVVSFVDTQDGIIYLVMRKADWYDGICGTFLRVKNDNDDIWIQAGIATDGEGNTFLQISIEDAADGDTTGATSFTLPIRQHGDFIFLELKRTSSPHAVIVLDALTGEQLADLATQKGLYGPWYSMSLSGLNHFLHEIIWQSGYPENEIEIQAYFMNKYSRLL